MKEMTNLADQIMIGFAEEMILACCHINTDVSLHEENINV